MVKGKAAYFVLGVVVLTAIILRLFSKEDNWICVNGSWEKHGNPSAAKPNKSCSGSEPLDEQKFILEGEPATSTLATTTISAVIDSPQANSVISSPLVVKGEAPGNWFFEASLPIKLLDNNGNIIVSSPASAEGDWMTTNLVSFKTLLEFNTTATSGYLMVSRDNPSGLPENDASVKIPVLFLNK